MGTSLIKIEGVNDKKDTGFYLGKRVCYVYRASRQQQDRQGVKTTVRSIWGRVSKAHGNGGTVRAVFDTKCVAMFFARAHKFFSFSISKCFSSFNHTQLLHIRHADTWHSLPANAMGSRVRVMLFPSNI